jgi:hypothetical protein
MPKSFGGFGTRYCGERDYRKDGSYMTTTFFCLLFFPVFPLHSVRVIPDPKNNEWDEMNESYYLVSEKRAPNLPQVFSVYVFEAAVIALMFLDIVKIEPILKSRFAWFSSTWMESLPLLLAIAPPFIVLRILRRNARKRDLAEGRSSPSVFV